MASTSSQLSPSSPNTTSSRSPRSSAHPYPRRSLSGPSTSTSLNPFMASDGPSLPPQPRPRSTSEAVPSHTDGEPIPVQTTASRGGCWTCRIRRKKCDEKPVHGSCQTCNRLKIECLGFGPKPIWMKEKDRVDEYKAQIKSQLANRNMIRGIPKQRDQSTGLPITPKTKTAVSSTNIPSIQTTNAGSGRVRRGEGSLDSYGGDSSASSFTNSPLMPPMSVPSSTPPLVTPAKPHPRISSNNEPAVVDPSPHSMLLPLPQQMPMMQEFGDAFPIAQLTESPMPMTHPLPLSTTPTPVPKEHWAAYYFQNVFQFQYIFALDPCVSNAIHHYIVQDPNGPVTSAICALATLHHALSSNQEDLSLSKAFYDDAMWQTQQSKQKHGHYSEIDAMAALHLVSYWLFCGGTGEWLQPLDIAREWFESLPIINNPQSNPKLFLMNSHDTTKYVCKAIMWLDIFSSISMIVSPRFISLYRRLLHGGSGFWAQNSPTELEELRLDVFMGCPDEVMLALAEAADLAQWKARQRASRCLSVRELVDRANIIESTLRPTNIPSQRRPSSSSIHTPSPSITMPTLSSPVTTESSLATPTLGHVPSAQDPLEFRQLVGEVFRSAALLYLNTVTNDHHPRVPEIRDALRGMFRALELLPFTEFDRGLVLPILIAGCATDDPTALHNLRTRLSTRHQHVGSVAQVLQILDTVWHRQQLSNTEVDWRNVLRETNLQFLPA